ncbi:MAG TPA: FAD/NAD(P)-binding protein [Terriglobia bacterium]|nr:FAD/NAD(P)-binding protein [Terriglobia bacterium]
MKSAVEELKNLALHPMLPQPVRVRQTERETHDTFTLRLEPPDRSSGFQFKAGQFNMVYVFGVGEVPISISGDPAKPETLVHTTRAVGAVTDAFCRSRRGTAIGIRGPFGSGWPLADAACRDVVIIAGGIGLAPLRPVLYTIVSNRQQYGKVALLYGTRTPEDILYQKELERWRARFDLQIEVTVDRAPAAWRGTVAVVTALIPRATFDPGRTTALLCGPEVMMRFAARALLDRGVSPNHIYLSLERNMKCAVGFCGHCQFGPTFICKDGPVFRYDRIAPLLGIREM